MRKTKLGELLSIWYYFRKIRTVEMTCSQLAVLHYSS